MKTNKLNRRGFLGKAAGIAGGMTAGTSFAALCGMETGRQGLGPFFPRPGTPEEPVRENDDQNVPIYLANDNDLTFVKNREKKAQGEIVNIVGTIMDSDCNPIEDATVIIWQASKSGRYNHTGDGNNERFRDPRDGKWIERKLDPDFQYWGKYKTTKDGQYSFKTIVPGFYPADLNGGWYRPPHIHFMVTATGFPQLVTQMYFRSEKFEESEWIQELNEKDYLLQSRNLSDEQRKALIVDFEFDSELSEFNGKFDLILNRD